jgi:hypothetical protein
MIYHNESNKIWVCIFLIFLRIYMDFTKISKTHVLFKLQLFTKIPGIFCRFTTMSLLHTKHPRN